LAGVFVSYAREDGAFVRRLHDALAAADRDPAWDQDHEVIPFSSLYEDEITAAITAADKFVFVISPDSLASQPCAWELATAQEAGKQVIPLLRRAVPADQSIPAAIAKRNWIFFDDDDRFQDAFSELIQTLDTDIAWITRHKQLQVRAKDWADADAAKSKLLRGTDLNNAEKWLADESSHPTTPPTTLQRQYLAASRRAATQTTRTISGALAAGLAVALALAVIALVQRNHAQHEATAAQARQLAAQAVADLPVNPATSLRLALRSTMLNSSSQGTRALQLALADDSLRMTFNPGFGPGAQAVWDPNAEIIAAAGKGNTVQLWNPRTGKLLRILGSLPRGYPRARYSPRSPGVAWSRSGTPPPISPSTCRRSTTHCAPKPPRPRPTSMAATSRRCGNPAQGI
jgi:hypothetical protein